MFAGARPRHQNQQDEQSRLAARDIVDILLQWKRPVPLSTILQEPAFQRWDSRTLQTFLNDFPDNFSLCNDDRGNLSVELAPKNLQICALHCTKDKTCPGHIPYCTGLHICKFYILSSSCKFKNLCHFGHDITTAHNSQVLRNNLLEGCKPGEVQFLLKRSASREGATVPKICKFYNHNRGCKFNEGGKSCSCLHVCKHYVLGSCSFGKRCKRNHDISADIIKILESHGIATNRSPKEILQELKEAINREDDDGSSNTSESERDVPQQLNRLNIHQHQPAQHPCSPQKHPPASPSRGKAMYLSHPSLYSALPPTSQQYQFSSPILWPEPYQHPAHAPQLYEFSDREYSLPRRTPEPYGFSASAFGPKPYRHLACTSERRSRSSSPRRSWSGYQPWARSSSQTYKSSDQHYWYRSRSPSTTARSVQPELVCMYHLQGRCSFGQNCRNAHHSQPYQWMIRDSGPEAWRIVDDVQGAAIELTYSDANMSEHILQFGDLLLVVKFVNSGTMPANDRGGRRYEVRRISTISSAEVGQQPLATDYKWYWETPGGQWVEYGNKVDGHQATILSCDIEDSYIANPDGQREFTTQGHKYVLDFINMVQKNVKHKTERAVARRPVFVKPNEVDQRRKQKASPPATGVAGADAVKAPPHWNVTGTDLIRHYQTIKLSRKSSSTQREFSEIERAFCDTLPSTVSIKSINRIENGDLWQNYVIKRMRMEKKCPGKVIDERRLYHGTDSHVEAICKQGFDFRLSGTSTGTMYGKGSYFAMSAGKADQYTQDKVMFVVRVLVGDYVKGNLTYVRPPPKDKKDPSSDLYDSCVDNIDNPKIFVIFDNNGQVYPEYIIKYEMKY